MTDLTFCYLHMTDNDLRVLDTLETSDYITGELVQVSVDVPAHMIPPNPDDSDALPSQIHPSYPYGNPRSLKHPANKPRTLYDPGSRALFEDMGFGGMGVNAGLRWDELALDTLLPVDEQKEEAKKAAQARKMASGAATNHAQQQQQPQPQQQPQQQPQLPPQPEVQETYESNDDEDEGEEGSEEEDSEEADDSQASGEEESYDDEDD